MKKQDCSIDRHVIYIGKLKISSGLSTCTPTALGTRTGPGQYPNQPWALSPTPISLWSLELFCVLLLWSSILYIHRVSVGTYKKPIAAQGMLNNVTKCHQMSPNVIKWSRMIILTANPIESRLHTGYFYFYKQQPTSRLSYPLASASLFIKLTISSSSIICLSFYIIFTIVSTTAAVN
jgi:hypothetical protein